MSNNARYEIDTIIQTAIDGFWINDLDGNFKKVNNKFCEMIGYAEEELLLMSLADIEAVEKPSETKEHIQKIMSNGSDQYESCLKCKNGQIIDVEIKISHLEPDNIQIAFAKDITEKNIANKSIKESEALFSALYEHSSDSIMLLDNRGFFDCNPAALHTFGYPAKKAFCQLHPKDLSPPKQPNGKNSMNQMNNYIGEAIKHSICRYEWTFKKKDESVFPAEVILNTIEMHGKIIIQNVVRNIANRKKAEDDLITAKTQAEKNEIKAYKALVEVERTQKANISMMENAILAKEKLEHQSHQLKKARLKAEQASKAKSDFLSNMSHEIRTPMNTILGFSKLLKRSELTSKQSHYLNLVLSSGDYLLELINNILDLSKSEAERTQLEQIDFNIEKLADNVLKIGQSKIDKKNIEFYLYIHPDVPEELNGDPTRLRQMLINLIGNAIKFTDQGHVGLIIQKETVNKVNVPDWTENEDQCFLRFCVEDSGIGVPKEKNEFIFDVFSQADTSTTRQYGGTGLGLAICKNYAQLMKGKIWVESEGNNGSKFIFNALLFKSKKRVQKALPEAFRDLITSKTIHIIDDNFTISQHLKHICTDIGFKNIKCDNTPEYLYETKNANDNIPDIILIDILLENDKSFQLVHQASKQDHLKSIKIIGMTSSMDDLEPENIKKEGFLGLLTKPVTKNDLLHILASNYDFKDIFSADELQQEKNEMTCKGLKILVVDDNIPNQALIKSYFRVLGCIGDYAGNGQEAVEKIKKNNYDVCLMDLQMPVMGGQEATTIIRKGINKNIPILALTADVVQEDKEKALATGMNDYLTKPITLSRLKEKILKYSQKKIDSK
ncbi:MAG: response regulator [Candidatus Omnitrophica bacterium]|nr:response regulator [Candidatus Omnitrophota bacterium]